jgi:hypothetical protein
MAGSKEGENLYIQKGQHYSTLPMPDLLDVV